MTLSEERFQALVAEAIDALPRYFKHRMDNVYVTVEARAAPAVLRAQGLGRGRDLLGLYQGYPLDRRGHGYTNVLPDRIVLYREPILRLCRDEGQVRARVGAVLRHELAHHFGFSDAQLDDLEDF